MPAEEHIQYVPEPSAIDLRAAGWGAFAAFVLLAGSVAFLYAVYQRGVPVRTVPAPQEFAQPRVTTSDAEIAERKRLADAQNRRLQSWRWANDQHSLVQVSIDRAMQLLVQKGQDAWAPLLPPQPALTSPNAAAEQATMSGPGGDGIPQKPESGR